jgi:uncharacterized membrane protein
MEKIASVLAITSTGLLAGAFAYAFFAVVPTFYEVPLEVHFTFRDALMRHNGVYVQIVMALSILTPLWSAYTTQRSGGRRSLAVLASLLAATSFVVTRFGNVPINQMIKTWSAATPPPGYKELLGRWLVFHNIRTVTAVVSFLCVVIAETIFKKQ